MKDLTFLTLVGAGLVAICFILFGCLTSERTAIFGAEIKNEVCIGNAQIPARDSTAMVNGERLAKIACADIGWTDCRKIAINTYGKTTVVYVKCVTDLIPIVLEPKRK